MRNLVAESYDHVWRFYPISLEVSFYTDSAPWYSIITKQMTLYRRIFLMVRKILRSTRGDYVPCFLRSSKGTELLTLAGAERMLCFWPLDGSTCRRRYIDGSTNYCYAFPYRCHKQEIICWGIACDLRLCCQLRWRRASELGLLQRVILNSDS